MGNGILPDLCIFKMLRDLSHLCPPPPPLCSHCGGCGPELNSLHLATFFFVV